MVYFCGHWNISSRFGMLFLEKSGTRAPEQGDQIGRLFCLLGDYFHCAAFEKHRSSKSFWTPFI
jgi:hypothetical protein